MAVDTTRERALQKRIKELEAERDELQRDLEGMCLQQVGSAGAEDAMARMQARRVANLEAELATCRHTIASLEMEIADVRHDLQDAEQKKAGAAAMWKEEHSKGTTPAPGHNPRARAQPPRQGTTPAPGHHPRARAPPPRQGTTPAPGHHPRARAQPPRQGTTPRLKSQFPPMAPPTRFLSPSESTQKSIPTVGPTHPFPLSFPPHVRPFPFQRTAAEEEVRFYQRQAATALEQRDQVTLELEQLRTAKAEGEARAKGEIEQLRKEKASAAEKSRAEIDKLMKEKWDLLERVKEAGRHAAALVKQQELGDEKIEDAERGRREAERGREEAEREREEERRERERVEGEREEERRERERVEREREEERRERERVEREGKEEEGRLREEIRREREEGARLKEEVGRLKEEVERRRNGAREWEAMGRESEGQVTHAKAEAASIAAAAAAAVEAEREKGLREREEMHKRLMEVQRQLEREREERRRRGGGGGGGGETGTGRAPKNMPQERGTEEFSPKERGLDDLEKDFFSSKSFLAYGKDPYGASKDSYEASRDPYGEEPTEEMLSQAMREKVQALVMLAAEEERHLRDSQLVGSLRETIAGLNATLGQVTAEKVKALMQLADTAAEAQQLRDEMAALQQEVRKRDEIIARDSLPWQSAETAGVWSAGSESTMIPALWSSSPSHDPSLPWQSAETAGVWSAGSLPWQSAETAGVWSAGSESTMIPALRSSSPSGPPRPPVLLALRSSSPSHDPFDSIADPLLPSPPLSPQLPPLAERGDSRGLVCRSAETAGVWSAGSESTMIPALWSSSPSHDPFDSSAGSEVTPSVVVRLRVDKVALEEALATIEQIAQTSANMGSSLAQGLEQILSCNKTKEPKKTAARPTTSSLSLFSPSSKAHFQGQRRISGLSSSSPSGHSSQSKQGHLATHHPADSAGAAASTNRDSSDADAITSSGSSSSSSSSNSASAPASNDSAIVATVTACLVTATTTTTTTMTTTTAGAAAGTAVTELNLDKSFWAKVESVEEEARQMRIVFGAAAHLPISWNAGGSGGGRMGGGRHGIPAERAGEVVASVGLEIAEFALVVVGLLRPVQKGF
ncbi:unnamed protein product [Closterium sp. Naga37s-1]|nr:unnamed protein product [Closterium sp. Naga37s-1]